MSSKLRAFTVFLLTVLLFCVLFLSTPILSGEGWTVPAPVRMTIPCPENYPTTLDDLGADAYDGALDHPGSRYYVMNDYYGMQSGGGLHILSGFETYQQTTEYTCGAASALMVLHRFGEDRYDEMTIAALAYADESKGISVEALAGFFSQLGWNVEGHADTEPAFSDIEEAEAYLIEKLDAGIPVMVDWVDWAGHWQVVIGLDVCGTDDPYDDVLILADSYDITDHCQDGYYVFPFGRFFGMWREGPCAQKDVPYEQPFVTAWPKEL
jgi:hypothetical protein